MADRTLALHPPGGRQLSVTTGGALWTQQRSSGVCYKRRKKRNTTYKQSIMGLRSTHTLAKIQWCPLIQSTHIQNSKLIQVAFATARVFSLERCRTFLLRVAMRKRGLCCRSMSVCPSVTLVHCIQTAEDVVKLLWRPGSPIILVF